jgi:hypothetical protein
MASRSGQRWTSDDGRVCSGSSNSARSGHSRLDLSPARWRSQVLRLSNVQACRDRCNGGAPNSVVVLTDGRTARVQPCPAREGGRRLETGRLSPRRVSSDLFQRVCQSDELLRRERFRFSLPRVSDQPKPRVIYCLGAA